MDVLVIGCGVSGLTTGLRLLQAGYTVRIWARDLPPHTTSNVAAAIWFPYKAYPIDRVTNWGKIVFQKFKELQFVEGSGILVSNVIEFKPVASPDPWWVTASWLRKRGTKARCRYPEKSSHVIICTVKT